MNNIQSKHDQIYEYLMNCIKDGEIGTLLPKENEIAEKLNVNKMSVSKVMTVLKSHGYIERKQGRGSTISKHQDEGFKGIISVLPGPAWGLDGYFAFLMQGVANECIRRGYVNVYTGCALEGQGSSFNYKTINSLISGGHYIGAVVIDTKAQHPLEWKDHVQRSDFPVVWLSMPPSYFGGLNSVDVDNRSAATALVEYLHSKGFKRIGYISGQPGTAHRIERYEGYKEALQKLGLPMDEKHVLIETDEHLMECGYKIAKRLAELSTRPDAFLVADCNLCAGIKRFSAEHGLKDLFNLPVATFDYEFTGEYDNVIVSTKQPFERMAKEALDLLAGIVEGKEKVPAGRILNAQLITEQQGANWLHGRHYTKVQAHIDSQSEK
ncbi:MAG: LacI family DNA-binding transcriptional regulator [Victivallaceae bacterium]|jgi:DNA-binding LacI/PurR family transcriptional regulator